MRNRQMPLASPYSLQRRVSGNRRNRTGPDPGFSRALLLARPHNVAGFVTRPLHRFDLIAGRV